MRGSVMVAVSAAVIAPMGLVDAQTADFAAYVDLTAKDEK
jgi:hypothetical protein